MYEPISALTDRQLLDRVSRNISNTEMVATQFGTKPTFIMDVTTAKRLVALAENAMPKTDITVPSIIDITPRNDEVVST